MDGKANGKRIRVYIYIYFFPQEELFPDHGTREHGKSYRFLHLWPLVNIRILFFGSGSDEKSAPLLPFVHRFATDFLLL